jgi:hypothetical protein
LAAAVDPESQGWRLGVCHPSFFVELQVEQRGAHPILLNENTNTTLNACITLHKNKLEG